MALREYQEDLIVGVRQAMREGCRRPLVLLGCGGGKTMVAATLARQATDKGSRVLLIAHRQELIGQAYRAFMAAGVDPLKFSAMMVQTACRRADRLPPPDLMIVDECHHAMAGSYRKLIDAFPSAWTVGLTATPSRLDGSGLGKVFDRIVEGPSVKWMIQNQYLAPYDYYAPDLCDLTGMHVRRGDYVAQEIEERMLKKAVFGDAIAYYRQLAGDRSAICYCATVKHSMAVAEAFGEAGIRAQHVDGTTPPTLRQRIMEAFKAGEIRVLTNVDLISEGFDAPDCGVSILMRPTQSLTLHVQQSMRCMRYKPLKRAVIIDHVGNYARFGLPDQDRQWSLEDKRRSAKSADAQAPVRQCPECYCVHPAQARICPKCGHVYPPPERTPEEVKEARLKRVEAIVLDYSTPENCRDMQELRAYAKRHGYKPGWAYYQATKRSILQ
jgi:superfamily II DNA or RNA helicase